MITPFDYINLFLLKQQQPSSSQPATRRTRTRRAFIIPHRTVVIKSERCLVQKLIKDQPISDEQVYAKRSPSTPAPSIY